MSLIVIKKIIEMFMILLVGVIIYKGKIIDDVSTIIKKCSVKCTLGVLMKKISRVH